MSTENTADNLKKMQKANSEKTKHLENTIYKFQNKTFRRHTLQQQYLTTHMIIYKVLYS
jgi:hypothetical protein